MRGANKHLVLPTFLFNVVLVSGLILHQSSAIAIEPVPELSQQLPTNLDRLVVVTEVEPDPVNNRTQAQIDSNQVKTIFTPSNTPTTNVIDPESNPQPIRVDEKKEPKETPKIIEVTLVIQGPGISLKRTMEFDEEPTVYSLLKQASSVFDFSLKVSQHSSLGMFVEGIAGVKNNPKNNQYWLYYVNGKFASRGVSSQIVKEGDLIKWSYE